MRLSRLVAVALLLALVAAGFGMLRLFQPYRGFSGDVFLDVPRGASANAIGHMLVEQGIVRGHLDFLLARMFERGRTLQAGEYRFNRAATPVEVYDRLARGDIFYYELTVPEGWNMFDIAAAVGRLGLFSSASFVEAARKPALIHDLDPRAPSLEGYLFPSSYRLNHKTTAERLCRLMTDNFRQVWKGLQTSAHLHDTVTLASLVEKEGRLAEERPLIASVFTNRLHIGMKLDCDPTTIYAALLDGRYRGTIYRSDLDSDNPYNTYRHAGLPPGPIANPGLASLRAALQPAASEALYFVVRPNGGGAHEFSTSIAQHEQAVERFRRAQQR